VPELPEVETMRRGILPIVGSRIAEVRLPRCKKRPILIAPSPATPHLRSSLHPSTTSGELAT
jgi:formamidopyrimidine-DNA glycosylase